jgi:hypothetical protein
VANERLSIYMNKALEKLVCGLLVTMITSSLVIYAYADGDYHGTGDGGSTAKYSGTYA